MTLDLVPHSFIAVVPKFHILPQSLYLLCQRLIPRVSLWRPLSKLLHLVHHRRLPLSLRLQLSLQRSELLFYFVNLSDFRLNLMFLSIAHPLMIVNLFTNHLGLHAASIPITPGADDRNVSMAASQDLKSSTRMIGIPRHWSCASVCRRFSHLTEYHQ